MGVMVAVRELALRRQSTNGCTPKVVPHTMKLAALQGVPAPQPALPVPRPWVCSQATRAGPTAWE